MSHLWNEKLSISLLYSHFLCAGPTNKWLHHPAFKGGGEGGSRHEEDPVCIFTEVHMSNVYLEGSRMCEVKLVQSCCYIPPFHWFMLPFFFIRQDVAFFDANKTGQLVNRLTADIQEFKSSFKLVISQVLTRAKKQKVCFQSVVIVFSKKKTYVRILRVCGVSHRHWGALCPSMSSPQSWQVWLCLSSHV